MEEFEGEEERKGGGGADSLRERHIFYICPGLAFVDYPFRSGMGAWLILKGAVREQHKSKRYPCLRAFYQARRSRWEPELAGP